MRYQYPNIDARYLGSLNHKWELIEYHVGQLNTVFDVTAVSAHFDGILFQLHTTHDITAYSVAKSLGMTWLSDRNMDLSHLKSELADHPQLQSAMATLWEETEYVRDYVNVSKHRYIVKKHVNLTTFVWHVVVERFTKDTRPHEGGLLQCIVRREVDTTYRLVTNVLIELSAVLSNPSRE